MEGIGDAAAKKLRLDGGALPFAAVERDAKAAKAETWAATRDDLARALAAWDGMTAALDAKAGNAAPPTGRVRALLERMFAAVNRYAPEALEPVMPVDEPLAEDAPAYGQPSPPVTSARSANRDDMLRDLGRIADYFRKFEPQSPLSLTLDEAIRRARLSWPELLEEVVANEDVRNTMLVQLGIRPRKAEAVKN